MVIQWHGQSCFRIQSGDLVAAIDPFAKETGLTPPRFRADIVLVTHHHYDHDAVHSLGGNPFLISGAGEYETKGIYIRGFSTFHDEKSGKERGFNTAYQLEFEDLKILHMGDFGEAELREETEEEIGGIDILMIPVGGKYTVDAEGAAKIVRKLEPRFVIPMHYKIPGLKMALDGVDGFLKEMSATKTAELEKFVVKKKDAGEGGKTEVIILKPA